jgi:hypothetical protein
MPLFEKDFFYKPRSRRTVPSPLGGEAYGVAKDRMRGKKIIHS